MAVGFSRDRWEEYLYDKLGNPLASAIVYQAKGKTIARVWDENQERWKRIAQKKAGVDDASVIQSALNALSNGGMLFIKKAEYSIFTLIDVKNKQNVSIVSDFARLKWTGEAIGNGIMRISGSSNVLVEGLIFDQNNINRVGFAIVANPEDDTYWSKNITVRRCIIENNPSDGVRMLRLWDVEQAGNYRVENVRFEHCIIRNSNRTDEDNVAVSFCKNITFDNCVFDNVTRINLYYSRDVNMINCRFYDSQGSAALIIQSNDVVVESCKFYNSASIDIRMKPQTGVDTENIVLKNITIIGGNGIDIVSTTDETVKNILMDGLYIDFEGSGAILLNPSNLATKQIVIKNFILRNSGWATIHVENAEDVIIKDGWIFDWNRANAPNKSAIILGNPAGKYHIENVRFYHSGTTGYYGVSVHDGEAKIIECIFGSGIVNKAVRGLGGVIRIKGGKTEVGLISEEGATFELIKYVKGYTTENSGTATFSGDGSTTQFSIEHGLVSTPSKVQVTPMSSDAAGDFYVTADDTYIYINYSTAPPSGTDNVKVSWQAEV